MGRLNLGNKFIALALSGTMMLSMTACEYDEVVYNTNIESGYDVIDSQGENVKILPQEIEVPGENFKLVIEYYLDEDSSRKWTITDNKKLYTKVYTKGLPEGMKVWIDNVHTDVSIVASRETMNGILQDTMDDRIHNSLMYGFPISDSVHFYGVNIIEGQNDTFIKGSYRGFNGYSSGTVEEKRYTEKKYLESGVYGNKIVSSYGVSKKNTNGVKLSADVLDVIDSKISYLACKKDNTTIIPIVENDAGTYYCELIYPISIQGEVEGVIILLDDKEDRCFSNEHTTTLKMVAKFISMQME